MVVEFNRQTQARINAYQRIDATSSVSALSGQFSGSSLFNLTVTGDLNDEELADISKILQQFDKVGAQFFHGNTRAAFQHAMQLDIRDTELATLSMNLSEQTRQSLNGVMRA